MTSIDWSTLREAIGGKWFLDLKALAWAMPFAVSTSVLVSRSDLASSVESAQSWQAWPLLLLANLGSVSVCAVLAWLTARLLSLLNLRNPTPIILVVGIGFALGLVKGSVTGLLSWRLGNEIDLATAISDRALSAGLLGAWLVPTVAAIAFGLYQYQKERDTLVAERVTLALAEMPDDYQIKRDEALSKLAELLRLANSDETGSFAQGIREVVESELRPLSHKLWMLESERWAGYSFREMANFALLKFPFSPRFSALAFGLTAFASQARYVDLWESFARTLFTTSLIFLLLAVGNQIFRNRTKLIASRFLATTLIVSVMIYYLSAIVFGQLEQLPAIETIAATWVWLVQLSLVGSIFAWIRNNRDEIRLHLNSHDDLAKLDAKARWALGKITNREFANLLHGHVQNRLLAVALRLDRGLQNNEEARAEIEAILTSAGQRLAPMTPRDLDDELARIQEQWASFAEVNFLVANLPHSNGPDLRFLITQIAEEAVANSIRHGLASQVNVHISTTADGTRIIVADNGLGPRKGREGLGSEFFDAVSAGNWSLRQGEDLGSVLQVTI